MTQTSLDVRVAHRAPSLTRIAAAALALTSLTLVTSVGAQAHVTSAAAGRRSNPAVMHRTVRIDGLDIFYREAGPRGAYSRCGAPGGKSKRG